jgi:hypothetical protein
MPDFTTRAYWFCRDRESPALGPEDPEHAANERAARGDRVPCGWHQATDGGDPVAIGGDRFCPRCSGPVASEDWAE